MRLKYNVKRVAYILIICVFVLLCICLILFNQTKAVIARIRIGEPADHEQYAGVLEIPSVEINLPCIGGDVHESDLLKLAVDAYNCGAKIWYPLSSVTSGNNKSGTYVIADHNWQGFSNIMGCKIGDIATFSNSDGSELCYVVKDMFEGSVDENGLLLDNEGAQFLQSDPTNIILTIRILLMLSSRHRRCFFGW